MLNEIRDGKKLTKNKIVVGTLNDSCIEFLKEYSNQWGDRYPPIPAT